MKIGFVLPTNFSLDGPGNGVRVQALAQADALRRAGQDVTLLNPWEHLRDQFDIVQFFTGGFPTYLIETKRPTPVRRLVFAPMIDSNEPNWRYRLAAKLGNSVPKVFTIPGEFQKQARGSDLIICRSKHERARVVDGLGIDPAKTQVRIVLNGIDSPPDADDPAPVLQRLALEPGFVFHLSSYTDTRKNAVRMAQAVAPLGVPLVIAGSVKPGVVLDQLRDIAGRYKNVRLLGFLSDQEREVLYRTCAVFCLPSSHEGTGLVALEAAARGAAVVITRHGGPPDYFGGWAQYVDPADVAGIRTAVERAKTNARKDTELQRHVLANLTWNQSAQGLIAAYQGLP